MEKMTIKTMEDDLDSNDNNDMKLFKKIVEPTIQQMVDMVNSGALSKNAFNSIVSSLVCCEEDCIDDDYIIQYIEEIGF